MPAYYAGTIPNFLATDSAAILGQLQTAYAADQFTSQHVRQVQAWIDTISILKSDLAGILPLVPRSTAWGLLLEFPLYRLRKRIDAVILAGPSIVVIEMKCGATSFVAADIRQVEEYCLDLRDFHSESDGRLIVPVLYATAASCHGAYPTFPVTGVAPVISIGQGELQSVLRDLAAQQGPAIVREQWETGRYRPVPSVIDAATSLYAGHGVAAIANADASNLAETSLAIVELVVKARRDLRRIVVFVTGVPGSGKTLAGLNAVHEAIATGAEQEGDIVYLSGNTPLVTVLREALARDIHRREGAPLKDARRQVRTRIQHINDFLKLYISESAEAPHEHAIVFDEAQRAWDEAQGYKKFSRSASEPALLIEIMERQPDWCALICLVGGGQEINAGEQGVRGWGDALRQMKSRSGWVVYGPPSVFMGPTSTVDSVLGSLPGMKVQHDQRLELNVPLRTYRSPAVSLWVACVLDGDAAGARQTADALSRYPIIVVRHLDEARAWLRQSTRGRRRYGLLASSGARRLRADGLGEILNAAERDAIAHWYLADIGDIRSSFALEVPANEYTSQGLELDLACVCWGGNFVYQPSGRRWAVRRLNGPRWQKVADENRRRYVMNAYRVLLTRAREGMVIWVPTGNSADPTREPELLDATAAFLKDCGAKPL